MIRGIGIDILERPRFALVFTRHPQKLPLRLLASEEMNAYQKLEKTSAKEVFLARAFCAKEAVSKALGTGMGAGVGWRDIELLTPSGRQPRVVLHAEAQKWCDRRGGSSVWLSFSHTQNVLAAVAILQ